MSSYESWRISFQSSEQAARAAFKEIEKLREALYKVSKWELPDTGMLHDPDDPDSKVSYGDAYGPEEERIAVIEIANSALGIKPKYLKRTRTITEYAYNPKYGDNEICECGHKYVAHFNTCGDMSAIDCKYCGCDEFL